MWVAFNLHTTRAPPARHSGTQPATQIFGRHGLAQQRICFRGGTQDVGYNESCTAGPDELFLEFKVRAKVPFNQNYPMKFDSNM